MNKHKKTYKICIRKLPSREYSAEDFINAVDRLNQHLISTFMPSAEGKIFEVDHFIEGKNSRKRGQLSSSGFISTKSPEAFMKVLQLYPNTFPFLDDAISIQPDIAPAPYFLAFRRKETTDKLEGTYEADSEYQRFLEMEESMKTKLPSAETQAESLKNLSTAPDMKDNPLIKYLRTKSIKHRSILSSSDSKSRKERAVAKESSAKDKKSSSSTVKVTKLLKKSVASSSSKAHDCDEASKAESSHSNSRTSRKSSKHMADDKDKDPSSASSPSHHKTNSNATSNDESLISSGQSHAKSKSSRSKPSSSRGARAGISADAPSISIKSTIKRSVAKEDTAMKPVADMMTSSDTPSVPPSTAKAAAEASMNALAAMNATAQASKPPRVKIAKREAKP